MEENKTNIISAEVAEDAQTTEIVENTEEQLVESCESEEESVEETEDEKETEESKPKVEPLPEQKPFLMSPYERAILEEMERRASDNPALAEGLHDKDKSIQECFAFVTNRAKKMADDNCAMIADEVVYSWAQFYYTQRREIIELEYKAARKPTPAPATTTKKTDAKAKKETKKADEKPKPKYATMAEKAAKNPNIEEVKGADGKTHTIESLSLF